MYSTTPYRDPSLSSKPHIHQEAGVQVFCSNDWVNIYLCDAAMKGRSVNDEKLEGGGGGWCLIKQMKSREFRLRIELAKTLLGSGWSSLKEVRIIEFSGCMYDAQLLNWCSCTTEYNMSKIGILLDSTRSTHPQLLYVYLIMAPEHCV